MEATWKTKKTANIKDFRTTQLTEAETLPNELFFFKDNLLNS
jgi:hypothetical protein